MKKTSKKEKYDVVRRELNLEFISWYDYYDYYDYDWYSDDMNNFSYVKKDFYEEMMTSFQENQNLGKGHIRNYKLTQL